ncbi:hypothetical protein J1614_003278 [Plenodomus biglobosus]|nr:hypothetical protein J1614_003278 [Plenodomus biglobosus]
MNLTIARPKRRETCTDSSVHDPSKHLVALDMKTWPQAHDSNTPTNGRASSPKNSNKKSHTHHTAAHTPRKCASHPEYTW